MAPLLCRLMALGWVMVVGAGLSLLMSARAAWGWLEHELRMIPDFELYAQGGLGVWPSVGGRLAGSLGPDVFAWLSIACAGLIVWAVYRRGGTFAAVLFSVSPASLYLAYAGIDNLGLAALALAAAGLRPLLLAPLAVALHLAVAPFALLELWRRRPNGWVLAGLGIFLGIPLIIALALTPYAGILAAPFDPMFLPYCGLGVAVGLALALPLLPFVSPSWSLLVPFVLGGLLCGLQTHLQARYLLPAVVYLAMKAQRPSWLTWPRRAPVRVRRAGMSQAR